MNCLRELLREQGRFPARRTWERRLKTLPETLPAQIGCLGRYLVELIKPWSESGRAVAIDSTVLRSRGAVWHQKHRQKGEVPHTLIDTEAHWTKSGWHGWVYGWKLHVVSVVAGIWFPLAALLTPANVADNTPAPTLLREVPGRPSVLFWEIATTTPQNYGSTALFLIENWLPLGLGAILTQMMGLRFDACFTNCALLRWKTSINTSKAFSMGMGKFPPKG